ncbi:ribosomal protection-like ABC-F family protein [Neobacillus mesonae]|uniref:ribosomal protection-like ABC-F family protein n=1 Tax=Neobacillus mesonae TaxID=1193713 RepID=UPI00203DD28D|nr:ABC-F type ribosomal protection protein [Neobacillus mesonae]MCM3570838.1 ABC-F type ribosomal protection protein [Neobacillus mesonae]
MKEIITIQDLQFSINEVFLFEAEVLHVKSNEVIGIVGKNGAGKSTLLQIIAGEITMPAGSMDWKYTIQTEFVRQEQAVYKNQLVHADERNLLAKLSVPMKNYEHLSGGEKLKARLAKGFAANADMLLLDEPTNHLDEAAARQIINFIRNYPGIIITVSHDRNFLDQIATKIWAIEDKKITEYEGNYSHYRAVRTESRKAQQNAYNQQQKRIKQVENQLQNLSSWSEKAHKQSTKQEGMKEFYRVKAKRMDSQIKSKQKQLENELAKSRIERLTPEYTVQFSLPPNQKKGKRLLEVKDLQKHFGSELLFEHVNLTIQTGDKIALIGPNGSGKTTFLNILMGKEPSEGNIWISSAAKVGYLTQEVFDLPLQQTPEQFFYKETFAERGKVQNVMKHLGFNASQWTEPISNMSMGERVKCKLMQFILEEKDLLLLDEPTNHLDLPSREQLEQTLMEYNGTILAVSHDRYFIEKITNKKWVIEDHQVRSPIMEAASKDDLELKRLELENEQQEILGKISFLTKKDETYTVLDQRLNEIMRLLRELKS